MIGAVTLAAGLILGEPVPLVWGVGMLALSAASFRYSPMMRFKANPRLGVEQEHTFSGTGISVRAGDEQGHLPWGFYQRVSETAGTYVLWRTKREGNFVPRGAFASPEDEARFRALAADHLPTSWSGPGST